MHHWFLFATNPLHDAYYYYYYYSGMSGDDWEDRLHSIRGNKSVYINPYSTVILLLSLAALILIQPGTGQYFEPSAIYERLADESVSSEDMVSFLESPLTLPSSSTMVSPIPVFPMSGSCSAGTRYNISSMTDLYAQTDNLDCLFDAALDVGKVPLGAHYGRVLAVANSAFWNPIIDIFYQGDHVVQTKCNGETYYLNILKFAGLPFSSGLFYLGNLGLTVNQNEGYAERRGLIMDFSVDLNRLCPTRDDMSLSDMQFFRPFWSDVNSNMYPTAMFQDVARAVGRDTDECLLLLGRTFLRDPIQLDAPTVTSWYFVLKNCDPTVMPNFTRGTFLTLERSFEYYHRGGLELLRRLNPFSVLASVVLRHYSDALGANDLSGRLAFPWKNQNPPTGGGMS